MGRKKEYTDIVIYMNKKWNEVRTESIHFRLLKNDNVRLNLCIINDNANVWSHRKPYDMLYIVTMEIQTLSCPSHIDIYRIFRNTEVIYENRKIVIR